MKISIGTLLFALIGLVVARESKEPADMEDDLEDMQDDDLEKIEVSGGFLCRESMVVTI